MEHVAIMKKSWGLTKKILSGEKRIESRWYKSKYPPWNRIKSGDIVYFKDSGSQVKINSRVDKVIQFSDLTPPKVMKILNEYGKEDGIGIDEIPKFFGLFKGKKYCMLIFLKDAKETEPFDIDKTGFGNMCAWICIDDVNKIKKI